MTPARIRPKPIGRRVFTRWVRRVTSVSLPPLSQRMPEHVPEGSTTLSDSGTVFHTMTPRGNIIGWDTCGRCGITVTRCKCRRPRPPHYVSYVWYQDEALAQGEEWDHHHPNYSRDFPVQEVQTHER